MLGVVGTDVGLAVEGLDEEMVVGGVDVGLAVEGLDGGMAVGGLDVGLAVGGLGAGSAVVELSVEGPGVERPASVDDSEETTWMSRKTIATAIFIFRALKDSTRKDIIRFISISITSAKQG